MPAARSRPIARRAGRVAGVDAFKDDPISFFKLTSADFKTCGGRIAKVKLPTLFVMEGGYAIEAIGVNTVNVLEGFLDG
jgi:acetoin utilization deacetylase AcuC-like enzyme